VAGGRTVEVAVARAADVGTADRVAVGSAVPGSAVPGPSQPGHAASDKRQSKTSERITFESVIRGTW